MTLLFHSTQCRTSLSFPEGRDDRYIANFLEKSDHNGERFKIYKGKMDGAGTRRGDKCVVKISKGNDLKTKVSHIPYLR